MSYAEELKHPRWQEKRLRVFERAGFQCERCAGADQQLHAHHKIYLKGRRVWDYPDDLLECLCDACHERAHEERRRLELEIARQPTAVVPSVERVISRVASMLTADDPQMRTDARNRVQDELDAIEDYRRGSCL